MKKITPLFLSLIIILTGCNSIKHGSPRPINKPKSVITPNYEVNGFIKMTETNSIIPPSTNRLFDMPQQEEPKYPMEIDDSMDQVIETSPISIMQKIQKSDDNILRIAVLLPLSGNNATIGNELKNAAKLALFNLNSDNVILQFYDSQGTYNGAKNAGEKIINDRADVIIGPVFADEVSGIKSTVNIPIISFTTDTKVIGNNTYSIGFLMGQQIKQMNSFLNTVGYKKIAIITPDSESGKFVLNNFEKSATELGLEITASKSYKNKKEDLMRTTREIANFDNRVKEYKEYSNSIKTRLDWLISLKEQTDKLDEYQTAFDTTQYQSTDDEIASLIKMSEDIAKKTTISDPDFESIFIYGDDINDLIIIGSSLMYFDVHPDRIKFVGTSQLANKKIYNERSFRGAWFPLASNKYNSKFDEAYKTIYGKHPNKIASLAYDAVALLGTIASGGEINKSDITNPTGWVGVNGVFRFNKDGESEREMNIMEITGSRSGAKIISSK